MSAVESEGRTSRQILNVIAATAGARARAFGLPRGEWSMSDVKKLAHNKKSAGAALGVGPTKLNELIASGVLRTVLIGGCVRIPDEELVRLALEGDGRPLRRGFNVHEAARASVEARRKQRTEREASTPTSPPQDT